MILRRLRQQIGAHDNPEFYKRRLPRTSLHVAIVTAAPAIPNTTTFMGRTPHTILDSVDWGGRASAGLVLCSVPVTAFEKTPHTSIGRGEPDMDKETMMITLAGMKEWFDRSTRVLEETDSTFAPVEGVFTTAQVIAHVAQTLDWFFNGAFAAGGFDMDFERMERDVRSATSLASARKWLDEAYERSKAAVEAHSQGEWAAPFPEGPIMGGQPKFSIIGALVDHTAHHRGALTVYSRLRGKVPAMPYMES